jgi:hypothetical protein
MNDECETLNCDVFKEYSVGKRLGSNLGVVIGKKKSTGFLFTYLVIGSHMALEPRIVEEDPTFGEDWNS